MKAFGVKGISSMRKDELLQLCLLYNPEIPSSLPPPSRSTATTSDDQSHLQRTRAFQESLDQEDIRESSEEDQPYVRKRGRAVSFASPGIDVTSDEEMDDSLPSSFVSPPVRSAASKGKGKEKQTSEHDEDPTRFPLPSREKGTALPRPNPTNLSRVSAVTRTRKDMIPEFNDDDDSDWKMSEDEDSQEDEDLEDNDERSEHEISSSSPQNPIESNHSMEEDSIDNDQHNESEGPASRIERILGSQITQLNNTEANQDDSVDLRQQVIS